MCLLRRAAWFEEALGSFKGKCLVEPYEPELDDWCDYDDYYEEEEEDDYGDYMASSGSGLGNYCIACHFWQGDILTTVSDL